MGSIVATEVARRYYLDDLPYHNWDHAVLVAKLGERIAQEAQDNGIKIDPRAVYIAGLFHDAGYHESPLPNGYRSKEEYSAHIASEELKAMGESADFIKLVTGAIRGTERRAKLTNNEAKALRAADLDNVAGDYDAFLANSRTLKKEYENMSGQTISWPEWRLLSVEVLEDYLDQDLSLVASDRSEQGKGLFLERCRVNIERLKLQTE